MSRKISVIIPVYNVEKWLRRCLDSILFQPFLDIEVILINDGSTDSSKEICEFYQKSDSRVKLFSQINRGVSSARNKGFDLSTGEYVVFIDPDDYVSTNYFQSLIHFAEANKCDVVTCGYQTVPTRRKFVPNFMVNNVLKGKDLILSSPKVHSDNDLCFAWRTLYKTKMIKENNIRFNEQLSIGEDVIFNLECYLASVRTMAVSDILYFYNVDNPQSTMRKPHKPSLEKDLNLQFLLRNKLSEEHDLFSSNAYRLNMALYYITNIYGQMISNLQSENITIRKTDLQRILNYEMITKSLKEIGFNYNCNNLKEYIYYLAMKFKIYPILIKY